MTHRQLLFQYSSVRGMGVGRKTLPFNSSSICRWQSSPPFSGMLTCEDMGDFKLSFIRFHHTTHATPHALFGNGGVHTNVATSCAALLCWLPLSTHRHRTPVTHRFRRIDSLFAAHIYMQMSPTLYGVSPRTLAGVAVTSVPAHVHIRINIPCKSASPSSWTHFFHAGEALLRSHHLPP